MKKFALIFCLLMLVMTALFGFYVEIGDGTTTTDYIPFYGVYDYSWSNYILTSDQIGVAIQINGIEFNVGNTPNNYTMDNQKLYMKATSDSLVAADYPDPANNGFTLVFDGSVTWNGSGWQGINFDTEISYDGTSNLQIVWENRDGTYASGYPSFLKTDTGLNNATYKYTDNNFPVVAGTLQTYFPNTRLNFTAENEPTIATLVAPANGSANNATATTLEWALGENTTEVDVYFSDVADEVATMDGSAIVIDGQNSTSYEATELGTFTTYFWIVRSRNSANGLVVNSPVWSFTTAAGDGSIVIGTSSETDTHLPMEPYYGYSISQSIYDQEFINVENKIIEQISYYYNGNTAFTEDNIQIYLGHTSLATFETNTSWIASENLLLVYDGPLVVPATEGWVTLTLTAPFNYNNIDNLVVAFEANSQGYHSSSDEFYATATTGSKSIYQYSDSVNSDFINPASGTLSSNIPNIILTMRDISSGPQLFVTPEEYSWENTMINSSANTVSFSMRRLGLDILTINSVSIDQDTDFVLVDENIYPLDITDNIPQFTVTFHPLSEGSFEANITINDNQNGDTIIPLTGSCADVMIYDFPYSESFETVTNGELPIDWESFIVSTYELATVGVQSTEAYEGNKSIRFYNNLDVGADLNVITPPISEITTKRVKLQAKTTQEGTGLKIGVCDSNYNLDSFEEIETFSLTTEYNEYVVNFSDVDINNKFVVLKADSFLRRDRYVYIDNVIIEDVPENEPSVAALISPENDAVNIPLTSTIEWQLGENTTDVNVYFSSNRAEVESLSSYALIIADQNVTSYTFNEIDPWTTYYWRVESLNSISGLSVVSPIWKFTTEVGQGLISLTIGDGTIVNQGMPMEPFYGYTYTQTIYPKAYINIARDIKTIAWHYNGNTTWEPDDIKIYMAHTTLETFESSSSWTPLDDLTLVYDGTLSVPATDGWVPISLDTLFFYNNTDNLVIAFEENTEGYHSSGDEFFNTTAEGNVSLTYHSDSTNPDPASPPAGTLKGYYPNISLIMEDSSPPPVFAEDLFFSEYIEGSSNNKVLEIFNGTGEDIDLTPYRVKAGQNGGNWNTGIDLEGNLANGDVFVIANPSADVIILNISDITNSVLIFNGDDAIGLFLNDVLIDVIGAYQTDPGTAWDVAGISNATRDHTLVRKLDVLEGTTDWTASAGTDVSDSQWTVYDIDELSYIGNHEFIGGSANIVEKPTFNPVPGSYETNVDVTLSTETPGASIYYTLDGSQPTDSSTIYTSAITLTTTTMIKAKAYADDLAPSSVATGNYIINNNFTVATLAELRAGNTDGSIYHLTSEVIVTHVQTSLNQIYVQDITGGILINNLDELITTTISLGDGITGLHGSLSDNNGMLEFIPVQNITEISSMNNIVEPLITTIPNLVSDFNTYESRLVELENIYFTTTGDFVNGSLYEISDGTNTYNFRTTFYDVDYIGTAIPEGLGSIYVIPNISSEGDVITCRNMDDFTFRPGVASNPSPANNSSNQAIALTLNWTNALKTDTIDLYFGQTGSREMAIFLDNVSAVEEYEIAGLSYSTTYNWKIINRNDYGETPAEEVITWSFSTMADPAINLPVTVDFSGSTLRPAEITDYNMSISSAHGNNSNGMYKNVWSSNPDAYAQFQVMKNVESNSLINFEYRIMKYMNYPGDAHPIVANEYIQINISNDGGANYTTMLEINNTNHVVSTEFANVSLPIGEYAGEQIIVRLDYHRAAGDYYVDFDNFYFGEPEIEILPPTNLQATVENGSINLTWSAPVQQSRNSRVFQDYNVYRDGICINSEAVLDIMFSDTNLVHGETYQYYVTAVYDNGESEATNIVEVEAIYLFLTGEGTEVEPYLINNLFDLYILSQNSDYWVNGTYIEQTADIYASDTQNWDDGAGFSPIGLDSNNPFTSSYDGQDYTISNLYINRPSTNYVGLFGNTNGATISNLGLLDNEVFGNQYVGSIVGYAYNSSTISNSYASGAVSGTERVGGLIGETSSSIISNSYASGAVSGTSYYIGGFIGIANSSTINNSYASGAMSGYSRVGGFIGYSNNSSTINSSYASGAVSGSDLVGGFIGYSNNSSTINNSYASGAVSGASSYVGGFIGHTSSSTISNSYASGAVSGHGKVGGFIGSGHDLTISNSYASGTVSGIYSSVGGFIGYRDGVSVSNSFWDINTSEQTTSAGGTGLTTSEMQTLSTYINAGWDFARESDNGTDDIWSFVANDYPHLTWEGLFVPDFTVSQTSLPVNSEVQFINQSVGSIDSYLWDFGDGTSSQDEYPNHTYSEIGVFTVSLTISNDSGSDTETKVDYITVNSINHNPLLTLPNTFTFLEDGSLEVDFSEYITDIDEEDELILSAYIGEFIYVEVDGFMVSFTAMPDWSGSEELYFSVDDQAGDGIARVKLSKTRAEATDNVEVIVTSVDDPMYIQNQIEDISEPMNSGDIIISLVNRFGDIDSEITSYVITGNTNPEMITTSIVDTTLTLSFSEDMYGGAEIELTVYNDDSDQVSMTFFIEIYPTPEIAVSPQDYTVAVLTGESFPSTLTIENTGLGLLEWGIEGVEYAEEEIPAWVIIAETTGSVGIGNNQIINLLFSGVNMNAGEYHAEIVVSHNNPNQDSVIVPVTMTVLGLPGITVSTTSLNFGNVFVNNNQMLPLVISNSGTSPLTVNNITTTGNYYSVNYQNFTIPVGQSRTIEVTFNPTTIGNDDASMNINSTDYLHNPLVVSLFAEVINPPAIEIVADDLNFYVLGSGVDTETILIKNNGASTLEYNLQSTDSWLNFNPYMGQLESAEEQVVTITANPGNLLAGIYNSSFTVGSNVPGSQETIIDFEFIREIYNVTDFDNENNSGEGVADNDLDVIIGYNNQNAPIEFNIYSNNPAPERANLSIRAWNIDDTNGGIHSVYLNGYILGQLRGIANAWTSTLFEIEPSYLSNTLVNDVQIHVDTDFIGNEIKVDWGQLSYDNTNLNASIRYINLDKSSYYAGASVQVSEEIDTNLSSQEIRVETVIYSPWQTVVASSSRVQTINGSQSDAFTETLEIAEHYTPGVYELQVIVYDNNSNLQEDLFTTNFEVKPYESEMFVEITSLDFGAVLENETLQKVLTIKNVGHADLIITNISSNQAEFTANITSSTIVYNETQDFIISFTPSALSQVEADLTIMSNASNTPALQISLSGIGIANVPYIQVSQANIDFGNVYTIVPETQTVIVTNVGPAPLVISQINSDNISFTLEENYAGRTLTTNQELEVNITFAPEAVQTYSGNITIASNADNDANLIIPVIGVGSIAPQITYNPNEFQIAMSVGESISETLQLSNAGGNNLTWNIKDNFGKMFDVDGFNSETVDYGFIRNRAAIQLYGGSFAVELWFRVDSNLGQNSNGSIVNGGRQCIVSKSTMSQTGSFGVYTDGIDNANSNKNLKITLNNGSNRDFLVANSIELNQWYHVAVSYNNNTLQAYLDGSIVSQETVVGFSGNYDPWILGKMNQTGNNWYRFDGALDEFRIWESARTEAQITNYKNVRLVGNEQNLGGYWNFDDEDLRDGSSYQTAGVIYGNATITGSTVSSIPNWVAFSTTSGYLLPDSQTSLDIDLDASGIIGGIYNQTIELSSNDPEESMIEIPLNIVVTGIPNISISNSLLDFGNIFIGYADTLSVLITNTGTDVLQLNNFIMDNQFFTTLASNITILAGESERLLINFTPYDETSYGGELTFTTNLPGNVERTIELIGNGVYTPQIGISQNSFSTTVNNGEITSQQLTISNIQGEQLNFTLEIEELLDRNVISGEFNNLPVSNKGMVWVNGYLYVVSYSQNKLYKYDLASESVIAQYPIHTSPFGITYDGENLWIGSSNGNLYSYDLVGNQVAQFSSTLPGNPAISWNGEHLLICASSIINPQIYTVDNEGNVINSAVNTNFSGKLNQIVYVADHTGGELWGLDYSAKLLRQLDPDNGNELQQISYNNFSGISFALAHNGRDLWIAPDVVSNAKLYRIDDGIEEFNWLTVTPDYGSLLVGEEQIVTLEYNARNLFAGNYQANLIINSNDADTPQLVVDVSLDVIGEAEIIVSHDVIEFGTTYIGQSLSEELVISNTGSTFLEVSDITSNNPEFTIDETTFTLAPLSSQILNISFTPANSGVRTATLIIMNNDDEENNYQVELSGIAEGEPTIVISPSSLTASLTVDNEETQVMRLSNTGGSDLTYSLELDEDVQRGESFSTNYELSPIGLYADTSENSINNELPFKRINSGDRNRFLGDFIASYPNMPVWNAGMYWLDDELYIVDYNETNEGQATGMLVKYDIESNQITASYPIHTLPYGITYDGTYLWIGSQSGNVHGYDPNTLNSTSNPPVGSFTSPVGYFPAITYIGDSFLINRAFGDNPITTIYRVSHSGEILDSYSAYLGKNISQLAWVEQYYNNELWAFQNVIEDDIITGGKVLKLKLVNGSIVVSNEIAFYDNSVIYSFANNGKDLWISDSAGPLFQIDDERWLSTDVVHGTIAPNEYQDINVTLDPTGIYGGEYNGNIRISSNDPQHQLENVAVTMTVQGYPEYTISTNQLNFGEVAVNYSKTEDITFTNIGSDELIISEITFTEGDVFTIVTAISSLAPGETGSISVLFSPDSNSEFSVSMNIETNVGTETVNLNGQGYLPPIIGISLDNITSSLIYGEEETEELIISNSGDRTLTYEIVINDYDRGMNKGSNRDVDSNNWLSVTPTSGNVLTGNNESVSITISATNVYAGSYSAQLIINSNDPQGSQVIPVELSVAGTPAISLSESDIEFGSVLIGNSNSETFTVTNSGSSTLQVTSVSVNSNEFLVTPPSFILAPEAFRIVTVSFTPQSQGTKIANVILVSNDIVNAEQTISLTGYGMEASAEISTSTSSLEFSEVNVGNMKELEYTLYNQGTGVLRITGISSNHPDFVSLLTPNANNPINIQPGNSKVMKARFTPTSDEEETALLNITSNAYNSNNLQIAMNGRGNYIPQITLNRSSLDWFMLDNTLFYDEIVITNEGQATLEYSLTAETISLPWFSASPISGSIGVGASATINLTIDTRNINNGSFFANFVITSNDPNNETKSVPMILNHSNFNFTETDNAGNEFVETPDNDLGVDINENSPHAPVEFFIYTDESEINYAKLRIRAYDIDSGEINYVFVNGTWVGQLVGRNNNYSITEFALDPALINLGENEANEIEITLDVNNSSSGYSKIIWGQFVFNQSPIYASINSLNLNRSNYYPGEDVEVNSILTTQLYSQTVRAEYELIDANLVVLDSYSELLNLSVTSNYQASASLQLPNNSAMGSYSINMTIYDNETNIKQGERTTTLSVLSGDPLLSVNEQINFGNNYIGYPRMRNIQITNQGYAPLSISSLATGSAIFSVIDRTFVLQTGESETVSVTFESLAEGSYNDELLITSNDPNNPSKIVILSANAIEPPQLELSTTAIARSIPRFSTDEAIFTISNSGNTALNISSISVSGTSWLSVNPASVTIAPDTSEEIELSFSSYDLNEGNYNAIVQINSNDPENSTSLITVTMTVLERLITANFTATPLTGAKDLEVVFTNYSQTSDDSEITEYEWDFQDDGTIDSYEINPTFSYENRGQYSVRLTVHNENNESHSLLRTGYISVINTAPILVSAIPNIVMNEDGVNQDIDLRTYFTDADNDNLIFRVSGDNHLQVQISNGIVTITPEQDWFGIEELTFTATDSYQAIANEVITVTVVDVSDAPSFVGLPTSISLLQTTKEVIDFANHLYDPEQSLSLLSLTIANNEHITYNILGLEVTLFAPSDWIGMETLNISVSDGTGRLVTSQELDVNITDSYQASFEADKTELLAGETIQFTDLTVGNPNHWVWYLDGDNVADSNEQNPSNPYNTGGSFSISLVVSYIDDEGVLVASDSVMYEDYITVEGTPIPGGSYFGTWEVAFSPYNVYGEVSVESGTALTIEEGTIINFMEDSDFIIDGSLTADGVTFGVANDDSRNVNQWQGIKFNPSSTNSSLTNSIIKNSSKAIEINGASPSLTGLNIEGVYSEHSAIKIMGGSQAIIDDLDIDKFNTAIEIFGDSSSDIPIITNIRVRHTTNTSKMVEDNQVAVKINNSNLTISNLDIEDYNKGIKIESTQGSSTPTLTNIRVRHTTNTSKNRDNYALNVVGNSSPILHEVDIEEFSKAIVFDALNSSTTPTLTNIRVRHTTNTSRDLGDTGIEFIGSINAVIDSLEIDDYTTALSFDNSTRAESSTPTLTNIRVRHTTNTSRTDAVALKSLGNVDLHIVGFESDNVKDGLSFYSDETTIPTLTNIRVRHTTNTSRDLGGTGIKMVGLIEAVMDSIQVDDCVTGIDLENLNRTESTTPILTNIRVRHTTNTSRRNAVAFKSVGLINFKMTNFESENVQDGINLYSDDEVIPVITNIRVRHTTNTRNMGVGITLSEHANAWIRNSLVEGFNVGIKASGDNQAIVEENAIIDNVIAVEITGEEALAQIHHNHIENQLEGEVTCFLINDNHEIQILNNNILGFNRIVTGANSSPYFSQNIIWGQAIALSDLASGNAMNATFEYNDIQMASGFAPGVGNMNQDPTFIDSDDYDLELSIYSNCIDAGNPSLEPDPDESIADLGMNYVHHFNSFNSTSRFVTLGTTIQFDNKSEGHDDVNTLILWEFGDGESSDERDPVHTYDEIGFYTTTLTMRTGSYTDIKSSQAFIVIQEEAISAPQNPAVTMTGASLNLTWEEVTESTIGTPVDNVTYLVYSCEEPNGIFEYRTDVETLAWTDTNIGHEADRQFYFILSFVGNDRASLEEFIRTHRFLMRNGEVVNPNFITKPKVKK